MKAQKRIKRPRDSVALAKLIGDIATGQVEETKSVPLTLRLSLSCDSLSVFW